MLVWVASFPRSGNNLTRQTLRRVYGCTTGSIHNPRVLLSQLGEEPDADLTTVVDGYAEPMFIKTHLSAAPRDRAPAIYIVRDPRSVFTSYARFLFARGEPNFENLDFDSAVGLLVMRERPWGSWSANLQSWTDREAPTAVVKFEELVSNPPAVLRRAMKSLGLPIPERVGGMPRFDRLKTTRPTLYRKGLTDGWRTEFPPHLEDLLWAIHGKQMSRYGYAPVDQKPITR